MKKFLFFMLVIGPLFSSANELEISSPSKYNRFVSKSEPKSGIMPAPKAPNVKKSNISKPNTVLDPIIAVNDTIMIFGDNLKEELANGLVNVLENDQNPSGSKLTITNLWTEGLSGQAWRDSEDGFALDLNTFSIGRYASFYLKQDGTFKADISWSKTYSTQFTADLIYRISDSNGSISEAKIFIFFRPEYQNYHKVFSDEDVALSSNIYGFDTSLSSSNTLSYAGTGKTRHGNVIISPSGSYVYTPDLNFNGQDTIKYSVFDGTKNMNSAIGVTVRPRNDEPAGTDKTLRIAYNNPYKFRESDFGFNGGVDTADTLKAVIFTTLPSSGIVKLNGTAISTGKKISVDSLAQLIYLPPLATSLPPFFTFQVVDDGAAESPNLVINGSLENVVFPASSITLPYLYFEEGQLPPLDSVYTPSIINGWRRVLSYFDESYEYFAAELTVKTNALPSAVHTPFGNQFGGHVDIQQTISGLEPGVKYTVSAWVLIDSSSNDYSSKIFQLGVGNSNTRRIVTYSHSAPYWQEVSFNFIASSEGFRDLRVLKLGYDINSSWDNITLKKANGGVNTDQSPNTITFSIAPVANTDSISVDASSSLPILIDILANDKKGNGSTPTSAEVDIDLNQTISGMQDSLVVLDEGTWSISAASGILTFKPLVTYRFDPTPIVYKITERATGLHDTALIVISYREIAEAIFISTPEDVGFTVSQTDPKRLISSEFGPNGLRLGISYFIVGNKRYSVNSPTPHDIPGGKLKINSNGTYSFEPRQNFHGRIQILFNVVDLEGTGLPYDGFLTINVTPVYDRIEIADNFKIYTDEDNPVNSKILGVNNVEGLPLIFSGTSYTEHGRIVMSSTGTYTYTPNANYFGQDTISYIVDDGIFPLSGVIRVTVRPINDEPTGTDKQIYLLQNEIHTFSAADFGFSNAADPNDTFAKVIITSLPTNGELLFNGQTAQLGRIIAYQNIPLLVYQPSAVNPSLPFFTFQVVDNGCADITNKVVNGSLEDVVFPTSSVTFPSYGTFPTIPDEIVSPSILGGWKRINPDWLNTSGSYQFSVDELSLKTNDYPGAIQTPFGNQFVGRKGDLVQKINSLVPGVEYTVSGWVLVDSVTTSNESTLFRMGVSFENIPNLSSVFWYRYLNFGEINLKNKSVPYWQQVSFSFLAPSTGFINLHVSNQGDGINAAWDNISLKRAGCGVNTDQSPNRITFSITQVPPTAKTDTAKAILLNLVAGFGNILLNDKRGDGIVPNPFEVDIDLNQSLAGNQSTLVVLGEGTWRVNTSSAVASFQPSSIFTTDPTPIIYKVTEKSTGLSDVAYLYADYLPRALNDSISYSSSYLTMDVVSNDIKGDIVDPNTLKLLGVDNRSVDSIAISGQGTWKIVPGGLVSFRSLSSFKGIPSPMRYLVKDHEGNETTATIVLTEDDFPPITRADFRGYFPGEPASSKVWLNDTDGDIPDPSTVQLIKADGTYSDTLVISGQGHYQVLPTGTVWFYPIPSYDGTAPTPVSYIIRDAQGSISNASVLTFLYGLCIDLLSFKAKSHNEGNQLSWTSRNEKDFSHFELLSSTDLKEFGLVNKIKSGSKNGKYSYLDKENIDGLKYYQLRMVDKDGAQRYSKIVSVFNAVSNEEFKVYPNPVVNKEFWIDEDAEIRKLTIYDVQGKSISFTQSKIGNSRFVKLKSDISPGVLFVIKETEKDTFTRKIFVK